MAPLPHVHICLTSADNPENTIFIRSSILHLRSQRHRPPAVTTECEAEPITTQSLPWTACHHGSSAGYHPVMAMPERDQRSISPALRHVQDISALAFAEIDVVAARDGTTPVRLSGGAYVTRVVEGRLLERLTTPSITALVGEAGYGKTALLSQIHRRLTEIGRLPLLIPATALLAEGDTGAGLTTEILDDAIRDAVRAQLPVVLLVDTLDLLLQHQGTRGRVNALLGLAARHRIPALVTSRPVEARQLEVDYDDKEDERGPENSIAGIRLGPFDRTEQPVAIEAYARAFYDEERVPEVVASVSDASLRGLPLREVCRIPLALRLMFELYAPDEVPPNDIDTITLYERYWWRRIEEDHRGSPAYRDQHDLSLEAEAVALALLTAGVVESETTRLVERARQLTQVSGTAADAAVQALHARGVLLMPANSQRVRFFHQTFFEHAAARGVASRGTALLTALAAQVAADPLDLFYGEVAAQVLLLAGRDARVSTVFVEHLLRGWLRTDDANLLTLTLRTYARMPAPSRFLRAGAETALRRAPVDAVRDYLRLLPSVHHIGFERVEAELVLLWHRAGPQGDARIDRALAFDVVGALARFSAQQPEAVQRFLINHGCLDWLADQPPDEWRRRDNVHLQLLEPLSQYAPRWCATELTRCLTAFASTRNVEGMAEILELMGRLAAAAPLPTDVATALAEMVWTVQNETNAERLEHAYAVLRAGQLTEQSGVGLLAHTCSALGPRRGAPSPWSKAGRRAELRACAEAAGALDSREAGAFLSALLTERDPTRQEGVCTVLGQALADEHRPPSSLAEHARRRCRQELTRLPADRRADRTRPAPMLFVNALHGANVEGEQLLVALPDEVPEENWYRRDALLPLLVHAALAGRPDAIRALRRVTTVGVDGMQRQVLRTSVLARLQYAARAGSHAAFGYLISEAGRSGDVTDVCAVLRRTTTVTTQLLADHHGELRRLRALLVEAGNRDQRRQGFVLWRLLLERGVERAPGPTLLVDVLERRPSAYLVISTLELLLASIRSADWAGVDPESLLDPLWTVIERGAALRSRPTTSPGGSRDLGTEQVRTQEVLARRALLAANARLVALPPSGPRRQSFARRVFALVWDAGYQLDDKSDRLAFTACFAELGHLLKRVGGPTSSQMVLDTAQRLNQLAPTPTRWREELASSWYSAIADAIAGMPLGEQERFVTQLLEHDVDLAAIAVRACIDHVRPTPLWLRDLEPRMPQTVREHYQSALYRQAREGSQRPIPDLFELALRPPDLAGHDIPETSMPDTRTVFVIQDRDEEARKALYGFLRALDLRPVEWEENVHKTGSAAPFLGDVLARAFEDTQAAIVLLTPDDVASLHPNLHGANEPDYETRPTGQPRANVLFEAGMALALHPQRTIIIEIGQLRPFSDIGGRNVIRFDGSVEKLKKIAQRLKNAGCTINDTGTDWLDTTRFTGLDAYTRRP